MTPSSPHWLIFGVGNPSRGDDAVGPMLIERLERWRDESDPQHPLVLLTDFQWQIEHALDLRGIDVAVFVDAAHLDGEAMRIFRLEPRFDATHSTHALSPQSVLAVAEGIGLPLPEAWAIAIGGHGFELGAPLSEATLAALDLAYRELTHALRAGRMAEGRFGGRDGVAPG